MTSAKSEAYRRKLVAAKKLRKRLVMNSVAVRDDQIIYSSDGDQMSGGERVDEGVSAGGSGIVTLEDVLEQQRLSDFDKKLGAS